MLHKLNKIEWFGLILTAFGLFSAAAQSQSMLHARVSFDSGALLVRGQDGGDWAHSTINTLILPGDTLWVDQEGLGEIEFAGGAFVRLADGSKADISSMNPTPTLRAWIGSVYIQRLARSAGDFIVRTPAASVEVDKDTAVRIDILDSGATTVTVRWGRATVRGTAGGAENAVSGQRVWIDPGLLPSDPVSFDRNQVDAFDQWNQERAAYLAGEVQTIPDEVYASLPSSAPAPATVIGASSLAGYGKWVYVENNYFWQPTVVDYVPYRQGYWNYVPDYGHVWVGAYPFCYYTTHYGYWDYRPGYGWLWSYTGVWQPAYVTAVNCNGYRIWTPITHTHYPVYVNDSFHFSVGGVNFSLYATSYAPVDYVYNPYHVYPVTHTIADQVFYNADDVYVWNINVVNSFNNNSGTVASLPGRDPIVVPYNDAVLNRVRDYNPSRSVRGVTQVSGSTLAAADRARALETSYTRANSTVKPMTSTGGVLTRTSTSDTNRVASPRNVRISPDENLLRMSTPPLGPSSREGGATRTGLAAPSTAPGRTTATTLRNGDAANFTRSPLSAGSTSAVRSTPATTPPTVIDRTDASSGGASMRTPVSAPSTRATSYTSSRNLEPQSSPVRTAPGTGSVIDEPPSRYSTGGGISSGAPTRTSTENRTLPTISPVRSTAGASDPGAGTRGGDAPVTVSRNDSRYLPTTVDRTHAPVSSGGLSTRGGYTPTLRAIPNTAPAPTPDPMRDAAPQYAPQPPSRGYTAPAPVSPGRTYDAPAPSPRISAPPSAPTRGLGGGSPGISSSGSIRSFGGGSPSISSGPSVSGSRSGISSGVSRGSSMTRSTAGISRGR